MPDPNDRPTASEIRDELDSIIRTAGEENSPMLPVGERYLLRKSRDLAAVVAEQRPSAIVNDINQRLLSLGKRIAALEAPGCEERLKATRIEIPDDYDPREVRAIELHDDAMRAEGAAAERERIRKIAEGLQSKRVATASGDYNDGRYNAYLDIISSTQPDDPAPEGEKAEERHIHEETPITPEYTHIRSEWVFNVKGLKQHDNQVREEERREILEMLGTDDKSLPPAMRGIETAMGAVRYFRAAIRARGMK